MGKWTDVKGTTVSITPFTDNGFKFVTLDCDEVLGGKLASGTIEMVHDGNDEALKLITTQETVDIELGNTELGTILTIHGIITNRSYLKNFLGISFLCAPDKDFYSRKSMLSFPDIDSAINSLWKGKKDIRTTSDLASGIKLNQGGNYDRTFLTNLCRGYKKETVFGYGLDGLLIKDLIGIDSTGNKEPYWTMLGGADVIQTTKQRYQLFHNKELYMKPEKVFEDASIGIEAQLFDTRYRLVHSDHNILRENLYNNQKFYDTYMYNQIKVINTISLQSYRLGDVVNYKRAGEYDKLPFVKYIISHIKYHIRSEASKGTKDDQPFKQTYTLMCLEENGEVMNEVDPKES